MPINIEENKIIWLRANRIWSPHEVIWYHSATYLVVLTDCCRQTHFEPIDQLLTLHLVADSWKPPRTGVVHWGHKTTDGFPADSMIAVDPDDHHALLLTAILSVQISYSTYSTLHNICRLATLDHPKPECFLKCSLCQIPFSVLDCRASKCNLSLAPHIFSLDCDWAAKWQKGNAYWGRGEGMGGGFRLAG